MAAPLAAAAAAAGINFLGGLAGAGIQARHNRKMAELQHRHNWEILQYQLAYNHPSQQMARFLEAGLNPNLIYGQGNPGNMDFFRYPEVQPANFQAPFANVGSTIAQMRLLESQAALNEVKITESTAKRAVLEAQESLIKANPYLNKEYIDSLVKNLTAVAQLKEREALIMNSFEWYPGKEPGELIKSSVMSRKIHAEIENLERKYKLQELDAKIKAQVIQSKQFENDLKEIEVKFLRDAEINPGHVWQFIMLLLSKLAGR
jgi:ATP-dependent Lon protease